MKRIAQIGGVLAAFGVLGASGTGIALGDGVLTLQIGSFSPLGSRVNDTSLVPSVNCGGAIASPTANTTVPYALVKISSTGAGPVSVRAERGATLTAIDPFLAAYCSATQVGTLLTADDDSGGWPTALLSGARGLTAAPGKSFYLVISAYSNLAAKRFGVVKLTVTGPAVIQKCAGDINYDGIVDDADFSLFAQGYNLMLCNDPVMIAGCPADLNADGMVDDADFSLFVGGYNAYMCP